MAQRNLLLNRVRIASLRQEIRRLSVLCNVRRPPPPVSSDLSGSMAISNIAVHLNRNFCQRQKQVGAGDLGKEAFEGLSLGIIATTSKEEILYFLLLRICLIDLRVLFRFVVCVCGCDALQRVCRGDGHRESAGQLSSASVPVRQAFFQPIVPGSCRRRSSHSPLHRENSILRSACRFQHSSRSLCSGMSIIHSS